MYGSEKVKPIKVAESDVPLISLVYILYAVSAWDLLHLENKS